MIIPFKIKFLEIVSSAKYLAITVTDYLNWGQHISNVTRKATKTLGFLRRNLTLAPKETKVTAYKALVRPQLEYAAPIWNPHHQTEINRTEKVQRTVARWACRHWHNQNHVGEILDELQWPELQEWRKQVSLTFCKIRNNLVIIDKNRYLSEAGRGDMSTRSHPFQYHHPNACTDRLKCSFFPRKIATWNGQPKLSLRSQLMVLSLKYNYLELGRDMALRTACK